MLLQYECRGRAAQRSSPPQGALIGPEDEERLEAECAAFWALIDQSAAVSAKAPHEAACKAPVATLLNFKDCIDDAQRVTESLSRDLARIH